MKNFQCNYSCLHFTGACGVKDISSPELAKKAAKKHLLSQHTNYPGAPELVKKQCGKTCQLKIEVVEIKEKSE